MNRKGFDRRIACTRYQHLSPCGISGSRVKDRVEPKLRIEKHLLARISSSALAGSVTAAT